MSQWETVAQGASFSEISSLVGEMELPKGTKMKVIMDLKLPLGWAFNFIAAEWILGPFVPDGMDLIDVYGEGSEGIVEMEADPAFLLVVLAFIKAHWLALVIAGFALALLVSFITIVVEVPAILQAPFWLLVGAALGITGLVLLARKAPT